jgi:hypothetical protein
MSTRSDLSDLIRALARRDWGTVDRLVSELQRAGWPGALETLGIAFATAVHRRFDQDASPTAVAQYVHDLRADYQDGQTLPALEMEGLIRAALGEHDLVDNIPADVALGAQVFILGRLLQDEDLTEPRLESFIADVMETAAPYLR